MGGLVLRPCPRAGLSVAEGLVGHVYDLLEGAAVRLPHRNVPLTHPGRKEKKGQLLLMNMLDILFD